jgi:hypothetical protein
MEEIEPLTPFQELCNSILGRTWLHSDAKRHSCTIAFLQVFADLAQLQLPWWKISNESGFFFFREHVLLNFPKIRLSLAIDPEIIRSGLQTEGYEPCDLPESLRICLTRILDDPPDQWDLYQIPTEGTEPIRLRQTLAVVKCHSIRDFEFLNMDTPRTFAYWHEDLATFGPDDTDWLEIKFRPGEFYQSLIPPEVVSRAEQSWLFRNP